MSPCLTSAVSAVYNYTVMPSLLEKLTLRGMVDEDTGFIGRTKLSSSRLEAPPYVALKGGLKGDDLVWSWHHPDDPTAKPSNVVSDGMLDALLRLRNGDDVLRYAKRFGVLELCKHKIIGWHDTKCADQLYRGNAFHRESIDMWLVISSEAREILELAVAIRLGTPSDAAAWANLGAAVESIAAEFDRKWMPNIERGEPFWERKYLARELQIWLNAGGVRIAINWSDPQIGMTVVSPTMYGEVGLQLLTAVSQSHGTAICSECGVAYLASRKPQVGRQNYCRDCGERAASRNRQRALRSRRRHESDKAKRPRRR